MIKKLGSASIVCAALLVSVLILGHHAAAASLSYNDDPVPGGMCGCGSCNCITVEVAEDATATIPRNILMSALSQKQVAAVAAGATLAEEKAIKAGTSKTTPAPSGASTATTPKTTTSAATTKTPISSGSTVTKSAASSASSASKSTSSSGPTESLVSSSGESKSSSSKSSSSAASSGSSAVGSAASKVTSTTKPSNTNTSGTAKLQDIHDKKESAQVKASGGTESLVSSGSSAASKGSSAVGSTASKPANSSGSPDDRDSNSSLVSGSSGASSAGSSGAKSSTQILQDIHDKREAAAMEAQGTPRDTSTGKARGNYNYNSPSGRVRVADNDPDYRSLFLDTSKADFVAPEVRKSSYDPEYFKSGDWQLIPDSRGGRESAGKSVPLIISGDYTVEEAVSIAKKNQEKNVTREVYYEYIKEDGGKGYVDRRGFLVEDPTNK